MDEDNDAVQQMMGFSSFGSNKRHKSNSGAASKKPQKSPGTASNSTPLGKRPANIKSPLSMIPASIPPSGVPAHTPQPDLSTSTGAEQTLDANAIQATDHNSLPTRLADSSEPTTTPSNPSPTTSHPLDASAATFTPATHSMPTHHDIPIHPNPAYPTQRHYSSFPRATNPDEIGYTSPYTGATLTHRELREYARGRGEVQDNGSVVTVFFKPEFLREDLWERWEGKGK